MIKNNLNPKLFDKDVEQAPIRKGFGEGLLIMGEKDRTRVVGWVGETFNATRIQQKQ